MRVFDVRWLALSFALTPSVGGCQTQGRSIPLVSEQAAAELPASQLPRVFKDPNPLVPYPYDIHETDALSRNPDECARWGCIDQGDR